MKFTDDDLKRLKEFGEAMQWPNGMMGNMDLKSLLARLEAAENVCNALIKKMEFHAENCHARHKCASTEVWLELKAWRKSKGE